MEKHQTQFGDLRKVAMAYKTELKAADESTEIIDKALQRWDERWNELNSMLNTTKRKVRKGFSTHCYCLSVIRNTESN